MATATVKTTYSLDPETLSRLDEMARRWGVSRSEALRRVIRRASAEGRGEENEALQALDELQGSLALSDKSARRWAAEARDERRTTSARREPATR